MKTFLLAFLFCVPFLGFSQPITFEDDFSSTQNWKLTNPSSATLSVSDHTLSAKLTGYYAEILSNLKVDNSMDFNLSFDANSTSGFCLVMKSSEGVTGDFISCISQANTLTSAETGGKRQSLKKIQFNPMIDPASGLHIKLEKANGFITLTMLEKLSNKAYILYSGSSPFKSPTPLLGFRISKNTTPNDINISNFKVQYYQYDPTKIPLIKKHEASGEKINLIKNHEAFGEKINLGKNVNSVYEEIVPIISADGTRILFTVDNGQGQTTYYSTLEDGTWSEKKLFSEELKALGKTHSIVALSADQNTAFVNGKWVNGKGIAKGVSKMERTSTGWSIPSFIDFTQYISTAQHSNSISSDQRYIVATLKNADCYAGSEDIFVFFNNNNAYHERVHLGAVINTSGDEITPFLAPDNKTLYFSSNGHRGYGSFDIFMSRRLDETWTNWSKPENLGLKINSDGADFYYSVSAKGDYAYLVTDFQSEGRTDIVRVQLPPEARPEKMIIVKGRVLNNNTKEPIASEIKFNDINTNTNNGIGNSDPATGNYQVVLPYGKVYQLYAEQKGYYALSEQIDLNEQGDFKIMEKDIYLTPIKVGEIFRLNNLFFETGSAALKPESHQELNRLVQFLNDNATMEIKISGHTDDVGTDKDNLELSQKRAASVKQYLSEAKISDSRISSEGLGESKPLASNKTNEGKATNRRVEFTIVAN